MSPLKKGTSAAEGFLKIKNKVVKQTRVLILNRS